MRNTNGWKALACLAAGTTVAALSMGLTGCGATPAVATAPKLQTNPFVEFANKAELPSTGAKTPTVLKIGDSLPAVKCVDLDGKPVDVDALYGKNATLVICWATWCGPCMADLPHEVRLAQAYKDAGLNVISVNADEDPELARSAIKALNISWPTIHDPESAKAPDGIVDKLGVKSWPTLLLFDRDRKLVSTSPELRTISVVEDSDKHAFAVRGLDITLTKVLGPLPYAPYISAVD